MEELSAAQGELSSKVGVAVARKANDAATAVGEAVLALLEGAVKLAREGSRGAVSAAAGPGETGGNVDVTA
jgi:hypothetical protein